MSVRELVGVHEHAVEAQDVRDEVVGEDRQAVDVRELDDAREMQVVGGDLGALEEADVVEERHRREPLRDALGGRLEHAQRRRLAQEEPEVVERRGVQARELVGGVEPERARHGRGVEGAQLRGRSTGPRSRVWAVSAVVSASVAVPSSSNQPEPKLIESRIST